MGRKKLGNFNCWSIAEDSQSVSTKQGMFRMKPSQCFMFIWNAAMAKCPCEFQDRSSHPWKIYRSYFWQVRRKSFANRSLNFPRQLPCGRTILRFELMNYLSGWLKPIILWLRNPAAPWVVENWSTIVYISHISTGDFATKPAISWAKSGDRPGGTQTVPNRWWPNRVAMGKTLPQR